MDGALWCFLPHEDSSWRPMVEKRSSSWTFYDDWQNKLPDRPYSRRRKFVDAARDCRCGMADVSGFDSKPGFSTAVSAERAFYSAFVNCDLPAMKKIWADKGVICIHPGSSPLVGREAVLRSWARILGSGLPLNLRVVLLSRKQHGDLAVHLVEESISQSHASAPSLVVATNVYLRTAQGWRLFEHHATAPGSQQRGSDSGATRRRQPTLQ